jgi:1-acyl-sn-glycerol-3-phosphate acyltransferase
VLSYLKISLIVIHTTICSFLAIIVSLIDRSFYLYFKLAKIFSKGILIISGIKLSVTGLENFDHKKIYVFVSNHSSQYDIPSLQYAIPNPISIVFKKELSKIPLFGWQLMLGPYIMIDRSNAESALRSIEEAKKRMIQKKLSPVVFAEGTRSKTGEVQPFKRGAFYLASKVGFPIVPVSVTGASKILPKGKFKIKSGTIYVHFDKPIPTESIINRKDELDLMEKVRDIIITNLK